MPLDEVTKEQQELEVIIYNFFFYWLKDLSIEIKWIDFK